MLKKERIIKENKLYKGKVIDFTVFDVVCPNGVESKRETVHHPGGVCILAVVDEKIVLERQYRFPYNDFIYELPAGKLEKGENPYDAAIRELEEETGLKAKSLIDLGVIYPSCGYTDEIIHLFIAEDVVRTQQNLDADEQLEICLMDKNKVKEMIQNNDIKDAKTLILLLRYLSLEENK